MAVTLPAAKRAPREPLARIRPVSPEEKASPAQPRTTVVAFPTHTQQQGGHLKLTRTGEPNASDSRLQGHQ
jgi:hypothetical protein